MLQKHRLLFSDELGTLQDTKVTLQVNSSVQPKFCKARPVPLALHKKVAAELDRLETSGVIEKVPFSEWAAPVVPVLKQDLYDCVGIINSLSIKLQDLAFIRCLRSKNCLLHCQKVKLLPS